MQKVTESLIPEKTTELAEPFHNVHDMFYLRLHYQMDFSCISSVSYHS